MSKCIVTGGLGFIGSHLVEKLLEVGHDVIVIDDASDGKASNLSRVLSHPSLTICYQGIEKRLDQWKCYYHFHDAEYVFHLAAKAAIIPSIENPIEYYESNVTGTLNVLEASRTSSKLKKFIYTASASCYGLQGEKTRGKLSPQYPYALTKMLGEETVLHWKKVYKIPAISLRLFNVYGPRASSKSGYGAMFGTFLAQKLNEMPLTIVGDGKQRRDFVYITDVVAALIVAMHPTDFNYIDIGTGVAPTILEIAQLISDKIVHIPKRPGEPAMTRARTYKHLHWEARVHWSKGVKLMLDHIEEWQSSPVWQPDSIERATTAWFRQLS